jgi:hypothetical protein
VGAEAEAGGLRTRETIMKTKKRMLVTRVEDIPTSSPSEDKERDWWGTHDLSDEVMDKLQEGVAEANEWLRRFRREYHRNHSGPPKSAS